MRQLLLASLATLLLLGCQDVAHSDEPLLNHSWHLSIETPYYGTLEGIFEGTMDGRRIRLVSQSTLAPSLGALPSQGTWFPEGQTVAFQFRNGRDGRYQGRFASLQSSFRGGYSDATITITGPRITGEIEAGSPFSGVLTGEIADGTTPLRDYAAINTRIHEAMAQHLFDPRLLSTEDMVATLAIQDELSGQSVDDFDLILTYALTTRRMPFSHFALTRPTGGISALLESRMVQGTDGQSLSLRFDDDIAILTIDSFVGEEIPAQIQAAFSDIQSAGAQTLIIDLRQNGGGSLAGAVLGNHIFQQPQRIGYFVSNLWWQTHNTAPTNDDVEGLEPFSGASLTAFYEALEQSPLLLVSTTPEAQPFAGQVIVLASERSTSMTELVLDAVKQTGRGTIIGAATPGQMVSSRFFDIGEDFVVRLPVADYFSWQNGRIEGVGVTPDILVESGDALERALAFAREN